MVLGFALLVPTACLLPGPSTSQEMPEERLVEGPPVVLEGSYAPGQGIHIRNVHGRIKLVPGSSEARIRATFNPFYLGYLDGEQAQSRMIEHLVFEAGLGDDGSEFIVEVSWLGSGVWDLGADIEVELAANFVGDVVVEQRFMGGPVEADLRGGTPTLTDVSSERGDVRIDGAAGPLSVVADHGSVSVGVGMWPVPEDPWPPPFGGPTLGWVSVDDGDLVFAVDPGLSGNIRAVAGAESEVVGPSPLPADWQESIEADNVKDYSFGSNPMSAARVKLTNGYAFGSIVVEQR